MTLLRRIKRLEKMHGSDNTLAAELRNMSSEELEDRIRELAPGFLELSPEEQENAFLQLERELAARGPLP